MRRTFALVSIAILAASQAVAAPTMTDSARSEAKPSVLSCSTAKASRHAVKAHAVNACQNDENGNHTVAYVFAGAAVAGVIAIAASTTGHHHITASP